MLLTYQTVKMYGEHEIIVQKSRFISYFERVTSEQEAQNFINKIKKAKLECDSQLFCLYHW